MKKREYTFGQCAQHAAELGFRDPAVGGSFLWWAMNCARTDLGEYIAELQRNRPDLFTRASRRTATRWRSF